MDTFYLFQMKIPLLNSVDIVSEPIVLERLLSVYWDDSWYVHICLRLLRQKNSW